MCLFYFQIQRDPEKKGNAMEVKLKAKRYYSEKHNDRVTVYSQLPLDNSAWKW